MANLLQKLATTTPKAFLPSTQAVAPNSFKILGVALLSHIFVSIWEMYIAEMKTRKDFYRWQSDPLFSIRKTVKVQKSCTRWSLIAFAYFIVRTNLESAAI